MPTEGQSAMAHAGHTAAEAALKHIAVQRDQDFVKRFLQCSSYPLIFAANNHGGIGETCEDRRSHEYSKETYQGRNAWFHAEYNLKRLRIMLVLETQLSSSDGGRTHRVKK